MLLHIVDVLADLGVARVVVVVGHESEQVMAAVMADAPEGLTIEFVEQTKQRGTGDAVAVALAGSVGIGDDDDLLVLPGDTPLLRATTLTSLIEHHQGGRAAATLLSAVVLDPTGYGRVVRGSGQLVERIVEQADANADELAIREVNTSVYCFRRDSLAPALAQLDSSNAQGELYLTDAISLLAAAGFGSEAIVVEDATEVAGVNDRVQLAEAEEAMRRRSADH